MTPDSVILVHDFEAGAAGSVSSEALILFAAQTGDCRLCRFTCGISGLRSRWKDFIDSLPCPAAFQLRPDFQRDHPDFEIRFPAILIQRGERLETLVSAADLAELENLTELIELACERFYGDDFALLCD